MKIACISDLHLATDNFADSFQHKEDCFLHFLDHLEDHYDQIILNGDIYDPCKSLRFGQYEDQLYQIQEKYSKLTERFIQTNYIQIAGNHDYTLEKLGFADHYSFKGEDGTKYIFFHGHQLDGLRSGKPLFIFLTAFANWLEKLGWKNAEAHLTWIGEKLGSLIHVDSGGILSSKAEEVFSGDDNQRVIVMGHSHEPPVKIEFKNNVYLNSGACVRKRIEYVHIDTLERDYSTRSWSETNRFGIATKTYYTSLGETENA
ncbi:MAG: hypothetical protein IEMM0008_0507 [bacterium]|nr:MAG: hypothetical protein IEMM0008_0507 [bacterium]